MSATIRRASIAGPGDIGIVLAESPEHSDADTLLAVEAVGVCGTDISLVKHGSAPPEQVLGHEIVGRVVAAPPESHLVLGERVMVRPIRGCHVCWYCRNGLEHQCDHSVDLTISYGRRGGFSDELVLSNVEPGELVPVHDAVETLDAVWAEPLAVAVHAVNRALLKPRQDELVVIGSGPLGLCVTAAASAIGVRVIAVEPRPGRRKAALLAGAAEAVHPDEASDLRAGQVCVTVGGDAAMLLSARVTLPGGNAVYAGLGSTTLNVLPRPYTVKGSFGYTPAEFLQSTALINEGAVSLRSLVTHVVGLDEIASAIEVSSTDPDAVKVVVSPTRG